MPEEEEVKRGKWTFAHLPAVPSQVRAEADREEREPAEDAPEAHQAQGRDGARQRLRRRPRGRAHLPLHRAVREDEQADQAPVAAVDDAGRDPRRLRQAAQRRDDAAARRRRRVPLGSRLARRHQRHARDDRVQLEVGRLPAHHRGPRADAHARDPGRARGEDPRLRAAQLLGSDRHVPRRRPASTRAAGSTRSSRSPTTIPTCAPSACGTKRAPRAIADKCAGKPGIVTRGIEAVDAEPAAAVRPHEPAARGQRPLRLLRRAPRCRSRRRCTRSTRCSRIRAPIRARCRRTTSPRSSRRSRSWARPTRSAASRARS